MESIILTCEDYVNILTNVDTHLNKCMMVIFVELMNRVEKRIVGFPNPKGYLFKLRPYEKQAILWIQNERHVRLGTSFAQNAVTRLLVQNN